MFVNEALGTQRDCKKWFGKYFKTLQQTHLPLKVLFFPFIASSDVLDLIFGKFSWIFDIIINIATGEWKSPGLPILKTQKYINITVKNFEYNFTKYKWIISTWT